MRIGLISDVHANLEATTAVLRELERSAVDRVVCLGDAVGYYANPNECVALLAGSGVLSIAGNHDRAAVGALDPDYFNPRARHAIDWTKRCLSAENAARLREIDVFAWLDRRTCLVHAALHPEPNDRYHLSTKARVKASFAMLHSGRVPARLCFFGHTHRPAVHRSDGHELRQLPPDGPAVQLELERYRYLINPGSVGQPRDNDSRASFAIFDVDASRLEFRRVPYDHQRCLRKAEAAGLLGARTAGLAELLQRFVRRERR